MQRRDWLSLLSLGCLSATPTMATQPPTLWLANTYQGHEPLADYWVSEKYDGIRGYWDGHQLLTRHGNTLNPPDWFTQNWPSNPIEGELWAGRGQFETVSAILQKKHASDADWKTIRFMVFDAPSHAGSFTERMAVYQNVVNTIAQPWVQAVAQSHVANSAELKQRLAKHVNAGAEGLMLHLGGAPYQAGRSNDLLKVKPQHDAEAKVTGHEAGQGKHAQRTGALWVETPQGLRFKLGTGLSDAQRENPPAIGQWVTYRYRGLTDKGVPRFASFVRIRPAIER